MKSLSLPVILLVAGSCLATLAASVFISVNYYVIQPKDLAKAVKNDPETFAEALFSINEEMQKVAVKKRREKENKKLEDQCKNPAKITSKGRVTVGDKDAPVTIAEFFDFQCPFCKDASESVKQLAKQHEGKVKLVYKHFPLDFHPFAFPAAVHFEAVAMEDHKKAQKFHDLIFGKDFKKKYARLKDKKEIDKALAKLVKDVGADPAALKKNIQKAEAVVQNDKEEGEKAGVTGTPNLVINGVLVPRNKTPSEVISLVLEGKCKPEDS